MESSMKSNEYPYEKLLPDNLIQEEDRVISEVNSELNTEGEEVVHIIGIQIDLTGKILDYLQNDVEVKYGDYCIVEMEKGIELGLVSRSFSTVSKKLFKQNLKKIIRKATQEDLEQNARNEEKGHKALQVCQKRILERNLPMKLVKVQYSFDGSKAVFYFTAEGRVDFRELVKDLASRFKTRIEMRQIGVRDEARIIKGYGPCGRQLCCSLFLQDFEPVSIRMAKDQCLTLNPGKISGICGRLMCCLVYEAHHYEEIRKRLPKLGERVLVNNEEGKAISFDVLKEQVLVEFNDGRVVKFKSSEVQRIKGENAGGAAKRPSQKGPKTRKIRPEEPACKAEQTP